MDEMQAEPLGLMLTRRQVASTLSVSLKTLDRWERQALLVPVRVGRVVRYRLSDVNAFAASLGGAA